MIEVEDDGTVIVASHDAESAKAAMRRVEALTESVKVGKIYDGRVTSIKDFGAFIEILPGKDGLCHISELSDGYVNSVADVCKVGDEMQVKVIAIDDQDRVKLSRKAMLRVGNGRARGQRSKGSVSARGQPARSICNSPARPTAGIPVVGRCLLLPTGHGRSVISKTAILFADNEANQKLVDQYTEIARLAGGLAHEIKNPLSTIRLNMELLAEDFAADPIAARSPGAEKIAMVQRECQRLQNLLDDFLNFAKVRTLRSSRRT